jgi:hypothetical protein
LKKVALLAVTVIAFALAVAPVSFAGEDDPGPTQSGEVLGTSVTLGKTTSKSSTSKSSSSKSTSASSNSRDTVRAKGAVQTGFGGAFATSGSDVTLSLALGTGAVILLAAAAGVAPLRRRAEG